MLLVYTVITKGPSDVLVTLLQVSRQPSLEEYRIHSELCVEERHVAIDVGQCLHAHVAFTEVSVYVGQILITAWTPECPPRCHLQFNGGR